MTEERDIFKGCKRVARGLNVVRERRSQVLKQFDDAITLHKEILTDKIQNNLISKCTKREKEFLNLRVADGKKLLDYIVEQFDVYESIVPGLYQFKTGHMFMRITDSEINNNGFYFDTGRNEISEILYSIFTEKLGMIVSEIFDQDDKFCLSVWSGDKEYIPL